MTMRRYLDLLGNIPRSSNGSLLRLLEGAGDNIFADVKTAMNGRLPQNVVNVIQAAKALKKTNVIEWFLSQWKVGFLQALAENDPERWSKASQALLQIYSAKYYTIDDANYVYLNSSYLIKSLEHFFSLPIVEINTFQFSGVSVQEALGKFAKFETAWIGSNDDLIEADPQNEKVLMSFPSGFSWVDLRRPSCEDEANAMGHCGNTASPNHGDTILSLRKKIVYGEKTFWRPSLTFILDRDHMLGEMKGRGNDKPAKKYHPEIIALLKSRYVDGIKGGGYMPENNFSIEDLPEGERDALMELKPGLADLYMLVRTREINDPMLRAKVEQVADSKGLDISWSQFNEDDQTFTVQEWSDLERFANDVDDDVVKQLLNIIEGDQDIDDELQAFVSGSDDAIYDMLLTLNSRDVAILCRHLGVSVERSPSKAFLAQLVHLIQKNTDAFEALSQTVKAITGDVNEIKAEATERVKEYIENGWRFECGEVYLHADKDNFSAPVSLLISFSDLVGILSHDGNDSSHYTDVYRIQQIGWAKLNEDNAYNREADGLMVKNPKSRGYNDRFIDPVLERLKGKSGDGEINVDTSRLGKLFIQAIQQPGRINDPLQGGLDI